jgi:2-polyprenyl-3-methyl-5-hydroxy-6-metoxy-1,4-benzoquinol methylase
MQKYWQVHDSRYAKLDYENDPDGLQNVCHATAPLWLNQYYARFQTTVYQKLFSLVRQPIAGARALDVGCGTARWCRFLADHGYHTVGIDLQQELMEINRRRYPNIEFFCSSIQDYIAEEPFDLISSVTVIQHVPFDEQDLIIQKLRKLVKVNAYTILLENIHDQGPHVFSNTIKEWQTKFQNAGFVCIAIRRYDYSFFIRLHACMTRTLISILRRGHLNAGETPCEAFLDSPMSGTSKFLRSLNNAAIRLATAVDTMIEPIPTKINIPVPTVHCGFLFKAI